MLPNDVAMKAWADGGMAAGRRMGRRGRRLMICSPILWSEEHG